jgi:hypothetical protein
MKKVSMSNYLQHSTEVTIFYMPMLAKPVSKPFSAKIALKEITAYMTLETFQSLSKIKKGC